MYQGILEKKILTQYNNINILVYIIKKLNTIIYIYIYIN